MTSFSSPLTKLFGGESDQAFVTCDCALALFNR